MDIDEATTPRLEDGRILGTQDGDDTLVVGLGYRWVAKDAPDALVARGRLWRRGAMRSVPLDLLGRVSCARLYHATWDARLLRSTVFRVVEEG